MERWRQNRGTIKAGAVPVIFTSSTSMRQRKPAKSAGTMLTRTGSPARYTGCGRYLRTNGDMEQKTPFCTIILTHWNETIHRYSTNPPLSVYSIKPPSASTVVPVWLRKRLHAPEVPLAYCPSRAQRLPSAALWCRLDTCWSLSQKRPTLNNSWGLGQASWVAEYPGARGREWF